MRRLFRSPLLMSVALVCGALLPTAARGEPAPTATKATARPTVAVMYFDYSGKDEPLGVLRKGLAQMLTSDLGAVEGVRLVERARLEEILAELKLAQSTKVDAASAARVGKLLGARYMVLGAYFDLLGTLRADARLVEVETGRVVQSVGASGKADDFLAVEQKLAADLTRALGPLEAKVVAEKAAAEPRPQPKRPRAPARLKMATAVSYAKALDALDHGDKPAAKTALQTVVREQPDFQLATLDLDRLMQ